MRKLYLLLLLISPFFYSQLRAQSSPVFCENFDPPSGPDSVSIGNLAVTTTSNWNDTNFLATSGTHSFHAKGEPTGQKPYFDTDPFSTVGKPYVTLSFNHIAKLFLANQARVLVSVDNGATWDTLDGGQYRGQSTNFSQLGYFNSGSYFQNGVSPWKQSANYAVPDSTWWRAESFDLTGVASDTTVPGFAGYPNVQIRFIAEFNFQPGAAGYSPGWFVDEVCVEAASCELNPPQVTFNFNPVTCYPTNPQGPLVAQPSGKYPVGVIATDNASAFDTGIDSVALSYQVRNGGAWGPLQETNMPAVPPGQGRPDEYRDSIAGLGIGDTVRYYVTAYDNGCPNSTRIPPLFVNGGYYTFWVDSALPAMCGAPFCGQYPTLIRPTPEWIMDFEGPEWVAGTGNGNPGPPASTPPPYPHRGTFPTYPVDYWTVSPSTQQAAGWSIRTGGTFTQFTGPSNDNTLGSLGGGTYLYLESSQDISSVPPLSALTTPCIDLTGPNPCLGLEFYYHMFGADIGRLALQIDTGNGGAPVQGYHVIRGQQQSSSSDNWKRAVVSLDPFKGKIIRLQFLAFNNNHVDQNTKGDIALDDIRIFEPDPVDIEVLDNPFPVDGYCFYGPNTDVEITLRNNGCQMANAIPIAFQVTYNGVAQSIKRDTIQNAGLMLGEDTTSYVFDPAKADFSQPGTYQVKVWSEIAGDIDASNDTVVGQVIQVIPPITNFPFVEDFESATPGTQVMGNTSWFFDDGLDPAYKWQIGTEMTQTRNTGPYKGFYWNGNYAYTEGGGSSQSVSTYLRTICLDLQGMTEPTLDFLYHKYGADINSVVVQVSKGDEGLDSWTTLTGSAVTQSNSHEVSDWQLKRVDLSNYINQSIKLRFKATRSGSGGQATDFAIDNVTVYDLLATDAGAYALTWPNKRGIADSTLVPRVEVVNYGNTTLQNFTLHMDITPLCGPNQGQTTQYTQAFTSQNILEATTKELTLNGMNIIWPVGESNVKIYTTATGDSYNFNDTISRDVIRAGYFLIPEDFSDDFDDCGYSKTGFLTGGTFMQWELGTPSYGGINGARSTPNAWVTNLDGQYLVGTTERLGVPVLTNLDTIAKAEIQFYQNIDMGNSSGGSDFIAAGQVQVFEQGQWRPLGFVNQNIGFNWYGSQLGAPAVPNIFGQQPGFVGSTNGRWEWTWWPLDQYNYSTSPLLLRFVFKSDGNKPQSQAGSGWGIDDFQIYVPPQNSASPIDVNTINPLPFPGEPQEFEYTVINTGGKVLEWVTTEILVDGVSLGVQTDTLPTGFFRANCDTVNGLFRCSPRHVFKFNSQWPGAQVRSGAHEVMVVTSRPNSKPDAKAIDDTLRKTIVVFDEIDLTDAGVDDYCNDFEGTNPNITEWVTTNVTFEGPTSWEQGAPVQFDSAYSGSQVWMTDLDDDYEFRDNSALYTPIFIVDSGRTYEMDFHHWFRTEQYHDGGNVEFTEDGGQTWWPIGWAVDNKPWYNTQFVTALDQIRPGWTDTTAGWENANLTMKFQNPTKLIFRFRFGADQDIENFGWAIDDFCYRKADSLNAQVDIGQDEFQQMPQEAVIGLPTPNPANDYTELSMLYPEATDMNVYVYDMLGQLVEQRSTEAERGVTRMRFSTTTWKPGVYFINVEYNGKAVSRKLVIAR